MQKDLKEGLVSEIKQISEGMKNLPTAITFPQFPYITAYDDDNGEEEEDVFIGDIAEQYLRSLLPYMVLIRRFDCGIRMVSVTLRTKKQK